MKKARNLALLTAATALAVVTVMYTRSTPEEPVAFVQGALAPGLSASLERVSQIDFGRGEDIVVLSLVNGQWVVTSHSSHPANRDKVRELLFGAAHLTKLEAKTRRAEHYSRLGLDEASAPARIALRDTDGERIFLLQVAKRPQISGGATEQFFARIADDPQVWLVEGRLPLPSDAADWLADEIVAIDRQRVSAVEVRHADGEVVRIERAEPSQADFDLPDLAAAESIKSVYALNGMASVFADLRLEDVRTADGVDWPGEDVLVVEMTTFDGLRLRMSATTHEETVLAGFNAEYDPTLREGTDEARGLQPAEAVQEETEALATRFEGWLYELPNWRVESLTKRRVDLVEAAGAEAEIEQ